LLPKGFQGRSWGPAKDTPMPKSALVISEYQNNLIRHQCMEQCAIYTFFTCGSYLEWGFWPNIPFFGYSWIQCSEGKLPKDPSGVGGIRYSVIRISIGG